MSRFVTRNQFTQPPLSYFWYKGMPQSNFRYDQRRVALFHILVKALRQDGFKPLDCLGFSHIFSASQTCISLHDSCFYSITFSWKFHIQPQKERALFKSQDPCQGISISMPQSRHFSSNSCLCLWLQGITRPTSKLEQTCDIRLMLWMSKKLEVIPLNLFLLSGWGMLCLAIRSGTATKAAVEKPGASVWIWCCISCCCQCQTQFKLPQASQGHRISSVGTLCGQIWEWTKNK